METVSLGAPELVTKAVIRQRVWEFLEKKDIANFPRPVYHRIPNFKGASSAAQLFSTLPEYQTARTVQVSPDKPQDDVRYLVLDHNKDLIVPTPGLAKGLFNRLTVEAGSTKDRIRLLASRQGIDEHSKPVPMASRFGVRVPDDSIRSFQPPIISPYLKSNKHVLKETVPIKNHLNQLNDGSS